MHLTGRSALATCLALALSTSALAASALPASAAGSPGIRISEVKTNPNPDFVELVNTSDAPIDLNGWKVIDADPAHVPAVIATTETVVAPGGFHVFDTALLTGGFGLGSADSVTIQQPDGTAVDSQAWTVHGAPTYSVCGDAFVQSATATPGAVNDCPVAPSWQSVKVNEVESNGDKVADWLELVNNGAGPVDISGWKILDADAAHVSTPVVVPANTTIPAGGLYAIYTEIAQTPGFGLGATDSVTVLLPDGTTTVDTYGWVGHAATTYGRCPSGTGDFAVTTVSTRGLPNACSPVRVNEVESSDATPGPDWAELVNISDAPVDVSGWVLKDSGDASPYTIAAATSIPAHGHLAIDNLGFGLGSGDAVRLYAADATTLIDTYAWTAHATTTYGRCKDGLGDFVTTVAATKGAANACPGLATQPWPGSQSVTTADLVATFPADLSGLAFDPNSLDVLWGSQNKRGTLWRLVRDGSTWVPDTANGWSAGKDPKFPNGLGAPDTEGITVGADGFLYAASERDNSASGISRMSILRYDPSSSAATLTATNEWDVTAAINLAAGSPVPPIGANLGLEGVAFVPDAFLTTGGFVDEATHAAYDPAAYPNHGGGLYVVAVEDTGKLYAFALNSSDNSSTLVATISTGLPKLADVNFDAERARLWAVADDTVDGQTSLLKLEGGVFVMAEAYDRPAGMPNLNNEGLAIAPRAGCVDGTKEVLWSDDGDTDGHSLRAGTITCTPPGTPTVTAALTGTQAPSGWYRSAVTATFTCAPAGAPITSCPEPVVLEASGADQTVSGTVTALGGGTATTTVSDIDIDRIAPAVTVGGVVAGRLYVGNKPRPTCEGTDALSGMATCTLATSSTPTWTTITATATDNAGNVATATARYRTLPLTVTGARWVDGAFKLKRGATYQVKATAVTSGRISRLYRGTTPTAWRALVGGASTVRIPPAIRPGTVWRIQLRAGGSSYTVKVVTTR